MSAAAAVAEASDTDLSPSTHNRHVKAALRLDGKMILVKAAYDRSNGVANATFHILHLGT